MLESPFINLMLANFDDDLPLVSLGLAGAFYFLFIKPDSTNSKCRQMAISEIQLRLMGSDVLQKCV
jgi:hypothetical protein